ncbi:hypothetical protein [Microbacterium sp. HJ5]
MKFIRLGSTLALAASVLSLLGCAGDPAALTDRDACMRLSDAVRAQSEAIVAGNPDSAKDFLGTVQEIGEATPTDLGTAMETWASDVKVTAETLGPIDATRYAPIRSACSELGATFG